jgi:hypothetical protein
MTDGEDPSIPGKPPNDYGFLTTRLSSTRLKSMGRSTEHLLLRRSAIGEIARPANSLLPGKLQSSSRTGNDCLRTFVGIKLDWPLSFRCYQTRDGTPSNFDIGVGMKMESWTSCEAMAQRCAFPTMRMHLHLGRRQQTMSTCADMVLAGAIGEVTAARHWLGGRRRSTVGSANVARSSFILTMTKRRLRQRMRSA